MLHINEKGSLILEVQEWINKSSGCGTIRLKSECEKEVEKILFEREILGFGVRGYESVIQELFPWANIEIDEAKKQYKEAMARYESDALSQMAAEGIAINKWKNESNLFVTIAKEYPDAIYQYHVDWLGLQSVDIFVPSLNMGFEYQGEQHYHPVEFFGGESAYKEVVARDERKAKLCKENGVKLVYWKYDEPISRAKLLKKLADV